MCTSWLNKIQNICTKQWSRWCFLCSLHYVLFDTSKGRFGNRNRKRIGNQDHQLNRKPAPPAESELRKTNRKPVTFYVLKTELADSESTKHLMFILFLVACPDKKQVDYTLLIKQSDTFWHLKKFAARGCQYFGIEHSVGCWFRVSWFLIRNERGFWFKMCLVSDSALVGFWFSFFGFWFSCQAHMLCIYIYTLKQFELRLS